MPVPGRVLHAVDHQGIVRSFAGIETKSELSANRIGDRLVPWSGRRPVIRLGLRVPFEMDVELPGET